MTWQTYDLDRKAQSLVIAAKRRDQNIDKSKQAMKEAHKMRTTVAYGLERFWGEHLRLKHREKNKSVYWLETWQALVEIMETTGVKLPTGEVSGNDSAAVQVVAEQLWGVSAIDGERLSQDDQRLALAVLTQLCDCMVWWTQRFREPGNSGE